MNSIESVTISADHVASKIFLIRGKKVMFDRDLAELYGVQTKVLNQAVKRNIDRFPDDFMFVLSKDEVDMWQDRVLRSQSVTLKRGKHLKYRPYVFTEQGVSMLSSVLKSKKAIWVNIQIIRTFGRLREILLENNRLAKKLSELENKYDSQILEIFKVLKYLTREKTKSKGHFGYIKP